MSLIFKIKKRFSYITKFKWGSFGKKSIVYKPLMIEGKKGIHLGKNVTIRNLARLECLNKWNNNNILSNISIGDNTLIEQMAHIIGFGNVKIGKGCLISARCFISSCNHIYEEIDKPVFEQGLISKDVEIGDNCFIGMDVKIFAGSKIGKNVIIGANSIVTGEIPPYSVAVGIPAKVIKKYDFEKKEWIKVKEVE